MRPQLCLTLTGSTLDEDLQILNNYRSQVDMAELRVDFLEDEEKSKVSAFPQMAGVPCILTIRRTIDGGKWEASEECRSALFEKIFSECDELESSNNFAFVDFEEDFHSVILETAAKATGARIIRSVHDFEKPVTDIIERVKSLQNGTDEIAKIAFMPLGLKDVTNLFQQAAQLEGDHILLAMGPYGIPSRILAAKLGNYLTFTSPAAANSLGNLAHLDPVTMNEIYHFRQITKDTAIYGITGFPLAATSSPKLHNDGYKLHNMDAVYVPVKAEHVEEALEFNKTVNLTGMSVTIPHKEKVMPMLVEISSEVKEIGACNTIVKRADGWHGYNTDAPGFTRALKEFLGVENLKGRKVAVIGAGGAACAIIYAIKKLGAETCIFNRTVSKAETLAKKFDCEYAGLDESVLPKLKEYSEIIVQTTSKGMNSAEPANADNDPIFFYDFDGHEQIYDIVYVPEVTPVMGRAAAAGCRVCNGFDMLRYQGYEQFDLFTGVKY